MSSAEFPHYLSAAALFRNDAEYLAEWIEFHRLVGVEHFWLYDNNSTDNYQQVLEPYIRTKIVDVVPWPHPFPRSQKAAIDDCVSNRRADSRWLTFIDIDQFLFSPSGRPVSDLLPRFERWPGVAVNWRVFGTSGHIDKPRGLVIESYTRSANERAPVTRMVNTIVDPRRTLNAETPHNFSYTDGEAVDEQQQPVSGWRTDRHTSRLLRINHYLTRSLAELRRKHELWATADPPRDETRPWEHIERLLPRYDRESDDTITMYVAPLRRALERAVPS